MDALGVSNDSFEERKQPCKADRLLKLFKLLRIFVLVIKELLPELLGSLSALHSHQLGFFFFLL